MSTAAGFLWGVLKGLGKAQFVASVLDRKKITLTVYLILYNCFSFLIPTLLFKPSAVLTYSKYLIEINYLTMLGVVG